MKTMTEQEKVEILDELEKRFAEKYKGVVIREDTQKALAEPRNKWFRDEKGSGYGSLMTQACNGNSIVAWAIWELIRKLTCYVCGKSYVRHLSEEDHADEVAEKICQLVYDLANERKENDE